MPNESAEARAETRDKVKRGLAALPSKKFGPIKRTFGYDSDGNATYDSGSGPQTVKYAIVVDTRGREVASALASNHRHLRAEFSEMIRSGAVRIIGR